MADRFLMYAALAAGAYYLLGRGAGSAAAGGGNGGGYPDYFMRHPGGNGALTTPFPALASIEPTDSGSYVAPDVIPETGVMCCQAMTPECMECAARNWSGVTRGAIGGIIPRPEQPNGAAYSYPDYFMRHPTPVVY